MPIPGTSIPGLDRDLVKGWWFGEGWNISTRSTPMAISGTRESRAREDGGLVPDALEGIKAKGLQGKKIGIDGKLYADELAIAKKVLPKVKWVDVSDTLLDMREVKTPEELALTRGIHVF